MPQYRAMARRARLVPVKSIKHVVDTNGIILAAVASVTDVIKAVDNPGYTAANNEINNGNVIHGIFLNVQVIQKVAAGGIDNIYLIVFKNPGVNLIVPPVDAIGTNDNRRYVLHQEMVMTGSTGTVASAIPKTLFKGVIAIPKAHKRFGINDRLQVVIGHRTGEATQQTGFCVQCIYKEFK